MTSRQQSSNRPRGGWEAVRILDGAKREEVRTEINLARGRFLGNQPYTFGMRGDNADTWATLTADSVATRAADAARDWDNGDLNPGSQDEENAAWHGMTPEDSGLSMQERFDESWSVISDRLDLGTDEGLGEACHVAQDLVSEGHRLDEYSGMFSLVVDDVWKTLTLGLFDDAHWFGDVFPDEGTSTLQASLSSMLVNGDRFLAAEVLEVVLGTEGGEGGSVEYGDDGAVTVTFPDGSSVDMNSDGEYEFNSPEESEPSAPPPPPESCPINDWSIVPDPFPVFPNFDHEFPVFIDPMPGWVPYDPSDRRLPIEY